MAYDRDCWLGCVTKVKMEEQSVEISFLHPKLPANSYVYPQHQDILEIDPSDVLTLVSPTTATGRSYHLTAKEVKAATLALQARK